MAERINNVQDVFLNALRKARTPVTLFLMKGIKLQGVVTGFDTFSVLLQRDLSSQLVYKHAISTIMPSGAIADFDPGSTTIPPVSEMQDEFLAEAARQHDEVSLFLMNGVMLQGVITGFDPFSLLLDHDDQLQLVYKHAVSTIQPVRLPSPKPVQAASIESPAS